MSDLETERVLLGALLLASPPWADVEAAVSAADFAGEFHRRVFRAMATVAPQTDLVLVRQAMRVAPDDERATSIQLMALLDGIPKGERWAKYAALVRADALERRRQRLVADYAAAGPAARPELLASIQAIEQHLATGERRGLPWIDLSEVPEPGRWLVKGIIPEQGRLLLVAPSGVGKSWMLADLALCVLLGEPWLGLAEDFGVTNNSGPVLYVDEESSKSRTLYRLARLCAARGINVASLRDRLLVCCFAGVNVGNPETWSLLTHEVRTRKPSLVILDAAIRIIDGDENASEVIGRFWRAAGSLQTHGTAVAVAHHTGWQEKGRSRGSSDFTGGADVEITIGKTDVRDRLKLTWNKLKDPPTSADPEPLLIDRVGHDEVKLVCAGAASKKPDDIVSEVYELILNSDRRLKRAEVCNAFPTVSPPTVDRALKTLKDSLRIDSNSEGYGPTAPDEESTT